MLSQNLVAQNAHILLIKNSFSFKQAFMKKHCRNFFEYPFEWNEKCGTILNTSFYLFYLCFNYSETCIKKNTTVCEFYLFDHLRGWHYQVLKVWKCRIEILEGKATVQILSSVQNVFWVAIRDKWLHIQKDFSLLRTIQSYDCSKHLEWMHSCLQSTLFNVLGPPW